MKLAIGIDPGASGAIAFFEGTGLTVADMPTVMMKRGTRVVKHTDAAQLAQVIKGCMRLTGIEAKDTQAFVEKVGAMPGQGVSSMFAFGRAAGVVEGVLAGLGIATTLVTPQTWMGWSGLIGLGKDGAREKAMKCHPKQATLFARKKDNGRADATMLATFAWHRIPRGAPWLKTLGEMDALAEEGIMAQEARAKPRSTSARIVSILSKSREIQSEFVGNMGAA